MNEWVYQLWRCCRCCCFIKSQNRWWYSWCIRPDFIQVCLSTTICCGQQKKTNKYVYNNRIFCAAVYIGGTRILCAFQWSTSKRCSQLLIIDFDTHAHTFHCRSYQTSMYIIISTNRFMLQRPCTSFLWRMQQAVHRHHHHHHHLSTV